MGVAMKLTSLTGLSLEKLEYGLDWEPPEDDEEVAEESSPLLKTVMHMVKDLDTQELELLKTLITYLKNNPSAGKTKLKSRNSSSKS